MHSVFLSLDNAHHEQRLQNEVRAVGAAQKGFERGLHLGYS
jgi:hypothetical protein